MHTAPRCDQGVRDIVCFDGTVDLAGGSLALDTPVRGLRAVVAVIDRRERGALFSQTGETRYRGRSTGDWHDLLWAPAGHWEFGVRHERLDGRNRLTSMGATRVATDASLLPYEPSRRTTLLAAYRIRPGWQIGIEGGRESMSGTRANVVGLRLLWTPASLYSRGW